MSTSPTISVCMIVKDEEKNLSRVLSSVRGLADEIIVVDTGSSDGTVEVAERYGAQVFHHSWSDDFAAARNESLKRATKDYILWLDADDEILPGDIPKIRNHLVNHPGTAVFLHLRDVQEEGMLEFIQIRIFPNHRGILFEGRIHEQVYSSILGKGIPESKCDACVLHLGYYNQEQVIAKLRRNEVLLREVLKENPDDFNILFFLARGIRGLGKKREALACLDKAIEIGEKNAVIMEGAAYKLACIEKAAILCEYERHGEAVELLHRCLSRFPNTELVRFTLGELHFKRREHEKAYQCLIPLRSSRFDNEILPIDIALTQSRVQTYIGVSALYNGDFLLAADSLKIVVDAGTEDISIYHYLALALERLGYTDEAIAVCARAMEKFGVDPSLQKRVLLLHVEQGSFTMARSELTGLKEEADDIDVIAAMFLVGCKEMDADDMVGTYSTLQRALHLTPQTFPEGYAEVRGELISLKQSKALGYFDQGVSHLLAQ
jgi:tetratricopeptide (TPR) repeat protein